MKKCILLFASLVCAATQMFGETPNYLRFTAVNNSATVRLVQEEGTAAFEVQYSKDGVNWVDYPVTSNPDTLKLAVGETVYFKAKTTNARFNGGDEEYASFYMDGTIEAAGNVMSLLDETMQQTNVPNAAFYNLFAGCESLITTPELPATGLSDSCYNSMFLGCSSLLTLPVLPATKMANSCYEYMFASCESLKVDSTGTENPWSIPAEIKDDPNYLDLVDWRTNMFYATGGTYENYDNDLGPEPGVTYYISSTPKKPTAVEDVTEESARREDVKVTKYMINGQLFIERDGITYDAQGRVVRR